MRKIVLNGILGLCVGDACGVPVEGSGKDERDRKPVMDMIGYGTYFQPPGTWSDGSAMTLATLDSLCNGLDYDDIMMKFIQWYDEAKYSAHGEVFDIGNVTRRALSGYDHSRPAYECGGTRERDNGNGSLMRILPIIYYIRGRYTDGMYLTEEGFDVIHKLSRMTHAHPISQIACGIYCSMALFYLDAHPSEKGQEAIRAAFRYYRKNPQFKGWIERFQCMEDLSEVERLQRHQVRNSGYVVDTLEAALWSFLTTTNYRDCVLKAVNLGGDSDTVGAIAGGLAGLKYGVEQIPNNWIPQLARVKEIRELCERMQICLLKQELKLFHKTIEYLETRKGKSVCKWKGVEPVAENVYHFSYAVYEKPVYEFMENIFPHSLFVSWDYMLFLKKRGFETLEDASLNIKLADVELCAAIITGYVRKERFFEGYWNSVIENGDLLLALKKLKELIEVCYDEHSEKEKRNF